MPDRLNLRYYICSDCGDRGRDRIFWVADTEGGMFSYRDGPDDLMLSCPWCDNNCWPEKTLYTADIIRYGEGEFMNATT